VRIVMVARNEEQLHLVAKKVRSLGAEAQIEVMDVTDEAGMQDIIDRAEKVKPLDIVFAVAGHEATMGKQEDIVGASRLSVKVNLSVCTNTSRCLCAATSMFFCTDVACGTFSASIFSLGMLNTILPAVPYMRQRKRGQLVMFSSQLGFFATPLATDYDACKVGIRLYGEGLRSLLWRDNVAVNVIVPGAMQTPMMHALAERAQSEYIRATPASTVTSMPLGPLC
jgi:NAD(P)-dependent dehydrogenase (short-subunit alcohol dehydrogenase family)